MHSVSSSKSVTVSSKSPDVGVKHCWLPLTCQTVMQYSTRAAFICFCRIDTVNFIADQIAYCSLQLPLVCRHQQQTGCDIVSGTRYKAQGGVCGWNFKRKLVSRGANFLAQTLLNPGVRATSGIESKPLSICASMLVSFQGCQLHSSHVKGNMSLCLHGWSCC